MFSKGRTSPTGSNGADKPRTAAGNAMPSIISADLKITGDLVSTGDIQVEGTVEGDIDSRTLTIGEGAQVRGAITAETVRICGSVTGQIKAGSVTLAKTAKVHGDILHQSLSIEEGAFLDGHCRRVANGADSKMALVKDAGATTLPDARPAPLAIGAPAGTRPAVSEALSR